MGKPKRKIDHCERCGTWTLLDVAQVVGNREPMYMCERCEAGFKKGKSLREKRIAHREEEESWEHA